MSDIFDRHLSVPTVSYMPQFDSAVAEQRAQYKFTNYDEQACPLLRDNIVTFWATSFITNAEVTMRSSVYITAPNSTTFFRKLYFTWFLVE
jgi:hypothetical protein